MKPTLFLKLGDGSADLKLHGFLALHRSPGGRSRKVLIQNGSGGVIQVTIWTRCGERREANRECQQPCGDRKPLYWQYIFQGYTSKEPNFLPSHRPAEFRSGSCRLQGLDDARLIPSCSDAARPGPAGENFRRTVSWTSNVEALT